MPTDNLDVLTLVREPGAAQRIRAVLLGPPPGDAARDQRSGAWWLAEVHAEWDGMAAAQAIAAVVDAALDDPDATVVARAVLFLQRRPLAVTAAHLLRLWDLRAEAFAALPHPFEGATGDLRAELARVLAMVAVRTRGPLVVAAVRDEALRPGRARTVMAALMALDVGWVQQHVAAIAGASPDALVPLLFGVRSQVGDARPWLLALRDVLPRASLVAAVKEVWDEGPERLHYQAML
jgi:hypothetical protein